LSAIDQPGSYCQAACTLINSVQSGNWSNTTTWDQAVVPSTCNPVNIVANTTVTIDISTATASTTTVNGILQFSPTQSSTFTVVQGSVTVNAGGALTIGTAANPIAPASTATWSWPMGRARVSTVWSSTTAGTSWFTARRARPGRRGRRCGQGAAALSVNTPVSGWAVGDLIVIDTEAVTITAISGGSISFAPIVGQAHASSVPVIVSNLSRNAVVRSSGSSLSNSAYVEDLVTTRPASR